LVTPSLISPGLTRFVRQFALTVFNRIADRVISRIAQMNVDDDSAPPKPAPTGKGKRGAAAKDKDHGRSVREFPSIV
jgi:hypothetical protein